MTLEDLQTLVATAKWFEKLGTAQPTRGRMILESIGDWNKTPGWEWLPNSHGERDVFHPTDFNKRTTVEEKFIFRETLKSLRHLPVSVPGLVSGPHNFTLAARNGAAFAARMATRELILNYPEKWQTIMRLYHDGFWPCGHTTGSEIVVL